MFRNYLKTAFRHLSRKWVYSLLTSLGLSVGLACMLLAVLYIQREWSYDRFHKKNPHLYRITTSLRPNQGDQPRLTGGTGQVQGPTFRAQVPEVEAYVRLMGGDIFTDAQANGKVLKLQTLFADDNFFNVFTFKLLRGNPQTALLQVHSVVITERTALRFFNSTNVVGKFMSMDSDPSARRVGEPLVISGVVENPPANSSIQFDALHPFRFLQLSFTDDAWLNAYLGTFVVLRPAADPQAVVRKFNRIYAQTAKKQLLRHRRESGYDPLISYGLQPMTDIHLHPLQSAGGNREGGVVKNSSPLYGYLFLGIAFFIMLMASINFVNISLADSLGRAKEVGIRKVNGGSRLQLMGQFLGESLLLCLIASVLSLLWLQVTLPGFNELSNQPIAWREIWTLELTGYFVAVLAANSLLTGLYPAYVLSGFAPVAVLYGKQKLTGQHRLGHTLVVVQFALAILLIIASFVFYGQLNHIRTKDLGYNPYQIIRTHINGNRDYRIVQQVLKNETARQPLIEGISFGQEFGNSQADTKVNNRLIQSSYQAIDEAYIPLLGIKVRQGRNFSADFPSDIRDGAIVNEAFVRAAGLQNPLGATLASSQFDRRMPEIIGVVRDFHFGSLRERIQPMVLFMNPDATGGIWLKVNKARQAEALRVFEQIYRKTMPGAFYEYDFLDELNAREYALEQRWQRIVGFATGIAIVICCLGLFGLTHLATHRRAKEIGIRKVLGASAGQIVVLLSKDFLRLVIIAFVIATPIAWYVMHRWLQDFAYRIDISWWILALAGGLAVLVALLTVGFQAARAALANPVESLRSE